MSNHDQGCEATVYGSSGFDLFTKAGLAIQPWQEDLLRFLLWLKEKHPDVEVSFGVGIPRRGYNAMMRRLRAEYEAEKACGCGDRTEQTTT